MEDEKEIRELKALVIRDLQLEKNESEVLSEDIQNFRERLIQAIELLLHNDYPRLLNAMYRLDIDERLFREALSGMHSPNVSGRLADLVIKREMEKIKTRNKYKS
jgi:hypothetical protein